MQDDVELCPQCVHGGTSTFNELEGQRKLSTELDSLEPLGFRVIHIMDDLPRSNELGGVTNCL